MKKLLLALSLVIISSVVVSGVVTHTQVEVVPSSRTAYGSMVGARFSADTIQYIGCALVNSGSPYAVCIVKDAANEQGYCTTNDPMHMQQVTGLNNEAYLYYQWDANGKCTYIYSQAMSYRHQ